MEEVSANTMYFTLYIQKYKKAISLFISLEWAVTITENVIWVCSADSTYSTVQPCDSLRMEQDTTQGSASRSL